MPIPQSTLETWSHQGAISLSANAYARIRTALTKPGSPLNAVGVRIFLQGSYASATNTRGDSDIDVVVVHEAVYFKDLSRLPAAQTMAHEIAWAPAEYDWADLKSEVLLTLGGHFGWANVHAGRKAIEVQTGAGRMTADIIPAFQHRLFTRYVSASDYLAHHGIQFFDDASNPIVNFPEQHVANGQAKNQIVRTNGAYKGTVRLFKNMRTWMVENGMLADGVAPSYYIECLLSNVPDGLFWGAYTDTVPEILRHLWVRNFDTLWSQNGITPLIGTLPTQWKQEDMAAYLAAAIRTWDNW